MMPINQSIRNDFLTVDSLTFEESSWEHYCKLSYVILNIITLQFKKFKNLFFEMTLVQTKFNQSIDIRYREH